MSDAERDLAVTEAAKRFIAKRRIKNTDKPVPSYRVRLDQFVQWAHERDVVELLVPEERSKGRIYGLTDDGDAIAEKSEEVSP
jgi:hypothetical protein